MQPEPKESEHREILLDSEEMSVELRRLAMQVAERPADLRSLVIIGIRTGGAYLAKRLQKLVREISGINVPTGIIDITLYRDDWTRIGAAPIVGKTELPFSIDDRDVLLVDDVIFTGRTIRAAMDALIDFGRPKSIDLLALVDRGGRQLPICAQYTALQRNVSDDETINVYLKELAGRDEVVIEPRKG